MTRSILLAFLLSAAATAQNSATIYGTVSDAGGAVVPGVAVTVVHVDTGTSRKTATDAAGGYVFPQLPVGHFTLRAQSSGFKEYVQNDLLLQVGQNRRADFALEIGNVNERIEVEAQAAQVETRRGTVSEVIDMSRVSHLPLNGRNAVQLAYGVPGVGRRGGIDQQQNETVSVNGSGFRFNNYALDGSDNQDPFFNTAAPFPNPDALQEFSVETSGYGADKGRNSGAYISAVTRSGTNQLHGTLFEYLRNEKLNARDFFGATVPPFKRNQFGGTAGGPIRHDRTFFFGSYQETRERSAPGVVTAIVLTDAMRHGDFSGLGKAVKDPLGGNFPNAVIPASRLYQPSQKFLDAYIPLPNGPAGLLSFASGQVIDDYQAIAKVDHLWTQTHRASWRILYNYNNNNQVAGTIPNLLASIIYRNWNGNYSDTWVLSPRSVNSITFAAQDIRRIQSSITPGGKTWTDFGSGIVRAVSEDIASAISTNVIGYFNAFTRHPLFQERHFYDLKDDLSLTRGAHLVRLGAEWRYDIVDRVERFQADPMITFRGALTGDSAADLILGLPDSIAQNSGAESYPKGPEFNMYVQDDWKISRRLTLNLGLRWDPFLPPGDKRGTGAMFRAGQKSTYFPLAPLGLVYWGKDASVPEKYGFGDKWNNFAPRFGFAYDPFGDGKSSIRGGYGIFYATRALQQIGGGGPGYVLTTNINPIPGGLANPYSSIGGNPYPFVAPKTDADRAKFSFVLPVSTGTWDATFRNARVQQWNLTLQRQVSKSLIVSAAYVGSKGNHLESTRELNPGVFGPAGNLQQRRVFPNFTGIAVTSAEGNMTYHSMQLSTNKRLSGGVTVLASYTWSKNIDNASGNGVGDTSPRDGSNFSAEKGLSSNNIPQRFVGTFIWELPSFKGASRVARMAAGGWEINGIISLESGPYFNLISGRDNSANGINLDRPDLIGNPFLPKDRPHAQLIARYFDPSAFRQNGPGTYGTFGRNVLEGPGKAAVDLALVKSFPVTDRHRVQFRAEAFNALNHVNFDNPNANLLSATVGRITSDSPPRVFQLALRYQF
jgi:Carboxypeptidase regulatory-like domain